MQTTKQALRANQTPSIGPLIEAAAGDFDVDRAGALASIARASALLRAEHVMQGRVSRLPAHISIRGGLASWQLRRVLSYIEANLDTTIRSHELSALTRLSTCYFFRAFKASLGVSPFVYIQERRIERACRMMLSGAESLSQIAYACGLCDHSHFCRVFQRVLGVTPGVWRRLHGAQPASPSSRQRQLSARPAAPFGPTVTIRMMDAPNATQMGSIDAAAL